MASAEAEVNPAVGIDLDAQARAAAIPFARPGHQLGRLVQDDALTSQQLREHRLLVSALGRQGEMLQVAAAAATEVGTGGATRSAEGSSTSRTCASSKRLRVRCTAPFTRSPGSAPSTKTVLP